MRGRVLSDLTRLLTLSEQSVFWLRRSFRAAAAPNVRYALGLGLATAVSAGLLVMESVSLGSSTHNYLLWNLFLAWIPFFLAVWLQRTLRRRLWSSWEALTLSIAWLAFLPNSFYMVSDFIHLSEIGPEHILISAVAFAAFIFTGLVLGISSLYVVHQECLKRVSAREAIAIVGALLLLSSFAIYVGRDLRWNTWDVLVNPTGLLFDLSERLLHPSQYGQVLSVVLPFFVFLSTVYVVVWYGIRAAIRRPPSQ